MGMETSDRYYERENIKENHENDTENNISEYVQEMENLVEKFMEEPDKISENQIMDIEDYLTEKEEFINGEQEDLEALKEIGEDVDKLLKICEEKKLALNKIRQRISEYTFKSREEKKYLDMVNSEKNVEKFGEEIEGLSNDDDKNNPDDKRKDFLNRIVIKDTNNNENHHNSPDTYKQTITHEKEDEEFEY